MTVNRSNQKRDYGDGSRRCPNNCRAGTRFVWFRASNGARHYREVCWACGQNARGPGVNVPAREIVKKGIPQEEIDEVRVGAGRATNPNEVQLGLFMEDSDDVA